MRILVTGSSQVGRGSWNQDREVHSMREEIERIVFAALDKYAKAGPTPIFRPVIAVTPESLAEIGHEAVDEIMELVED